MSDVYGVCGGFVDSSSRDDWGGLDHVGINFSASLCLIMFKICMKLCQTRIYQKYVRLLLFFMLFYGCYLYSCFIVVAVLVNCSLFGYFDCDSINLVSVLESRQNGCDDWAVRPKTRRGICHVWYESL